MARALSVIPQVGAISIRASGSPTTYRAAIPERPDPKRTRVSFVVDAGDADAIGDEAVWKDGSVVGGITSGGYCHHADKSLAIGYVPTEVLGNGADKANWQIEILGEMRAARLQLEPLFDPKAERMRGSFPRSYVGAII